MISLRPRGDEGLVLDGANPVGLAVADRLAAAGCPVIVTGPEAAGGARHPVVAADLRRDEAATADWPFLARPPRRLFAVVETGAADTGARLAETAWPWLAVLVNLSRRGLPFPRYVTVIITGAQPAVVALNRTQASYVTAETIEQPLNINILAAEYYSGAFDTGTREALVARFGAGCLLSAEQVADAAYALTGGLMDGVKAQTIHLRQGLPPVGDAVATLSGPPAASP